MEKGGTKWGKGGEGGKGGRWGRRGRQGREVGAEREAREGGGEPEDLSHEVRSLRTM